MNFWRISKCGQEFLKIRKRMERAGFKWTASPCWWPMAGARARATSQSGLGWLASRPTRGEEKGPALGILVLLSAQEERRPKT